MSSNERGIRPSWAQQILFLLGLIVMATGSAGCARECTSDADCPDNDGLFCNGIGYCNMIVVLVGVTTCENTGPPCSQTSRPVCDEALNDCNPCTSNEQCDDGVECTAGHCDPLLGCSFQPLSERCPAGQVCIPSVGCSVAGCGSDADCPGLEPFCTNRTCHVCEVVPNLGCPSETPYCACEGTELLEDPESSTCTRFTCNECFRHGHCAPGLTCINRQCK